MTKTPQHSKHQSMTCWFQEVMAVEPLPQCPFGNSKRGLFCHSTMQLDGNTRSSHQRRRATAKPCSKSCIRATGNRPPGSTGEEGERRRSSGKIEKLCPFRARNRSHHVGMRRLLALCFANSTPARRIRVHHVQAFSQTSNLTDSTVGHRHSFLFLLAYSHDSRVPNTACTYWTSPR